MPRDYSLLGEDGRRAVETGLASARWYRTKVDPQMIRALSKKSDGRATWDTVLWLGLMAVFAAMGIALWPTIWSLPFWLAYGVLYGSASDSRWHECGHGTAFKTGWKNDVVYHIASFMIVRAPHVWRASHVRHHIDTIVVGRDPEIQAMRPPDLPRVALAFIGVLDMWAGLKRMMLHASGRLHPEEETFLRPQDRGKVILTARIWSAIYLTTVGLAIAMWSLLPLMVIGLPRIYGAWHHVMTGLLQHLGLADNVTDHRLCTRTVLMNPVSRFIYLNMNYHIEHHMFTMVPYHRLPELHELIKHDLPAPEPSIWAGYRRLLPVLWRQLRYEEAVILPDLPATAAPYGPEVERLRPHAA